MKYWYEDLFADMEQSTIHDDYETIRKVVQNYNHVYEQTHSGKQAVLSSRYLFRELTMNYQPIATTLKSCEEVKDESMSNDESPEL